MANHHLDIKPVTRDCTRDCICRGTWSSADREGGSHSVACDDAYREKFFGTWTATRGAFYEQNPPVIDGSMN